MLSHKEIRKRFLRWAERSGSVGRVSDLRLNGPEFEIHLRRCVVSLSKTPHPLLSAG